MDNEYLGYVEKIYGVRQIQLGIVEEEILNQLAEHPMSREELLSLSTLLERIGSIDFSTIGFPGLDLPKKFLMNTIINEMISKNLITEENGVLKPTIYGTQYMNGVDENPEVMYLVLPRRDGDAVLLKPFPGTIYKIICTTDAGEGIYYAEPLQYIGVHIPVVKVSDGKFTATILFTPTTIKVTKKKPLFKLRKLS